MGAADVVPGVSGGTIAFITGIYEELLSTISSIDFSIVKTLRDEGFLAAWNKANGNFLIALFSGIGISVFSLAKGIEWLLNNEPIKLWSFFFGLVFASIFSVGKQVEKWNLGSLIGILAGSVLAYYVTILPPMNPSTDLWFLFLSGMIAICAMILPGISGSFILLILGSYKVVIQAISDRNFLVLATVGAGCAVGLLAFSRVLKWMFAKQKNITIAVLTGFLVGSLNKIWPWKHVTEVFIKHAGEVNEEIVPIVERSVLPGNFDTPVIELGKVIGHNSADPQIISAVAFSIVGAGLIFGMEFAAKKMSKS
jgi:putative membrane protein